MHRGHVYGILGLGRSLDYFQGISGQGSLRELDELLDKVGLFPRADSKFHTCSLGMKQRLGLAYALIDDPELLAMDEPTKGTVEIRDLIREI